MDLSLYDEWLLAQGLAESTVGAYRRQLGQAARFTGEQGWDLRRMTASQLVWLAGRFPQSRSSLGILRAALGHYWAMHGVDNPVRAIKLPRASAVETYKGLEDEEADRLEACARTLDHPSGLAVMLGLYLGLRRGEMAKLRWDHFDGPWVRILGKGRRERTLPVHETLEELLRPESGLGYVFPGTRRPYVHTGTIYGWVERVAARVGIEHINPHALRHTCLTNMYEQTGDLRAVQYFAGHADPATTAKYTRVTRRRLVMAVSTLPYGKRAA